MRSTNSQTKKGSLGTFTARFYTNNSRDSRLLRALSQCNGLMREQLDRDGIECRVCFYSLSDDYRARYATSEMLEVGRG